MPAPHRLAGDGLSAKDRADLDKIENPFMRARAEYLRRAGKVANALELFVRGHDMRGKLMRSKVLTPLFYQNGRPLFESYQYPQEFLPVLDAILNAPYLNQDYSWPSTNDVSAVKSKLDFVYEGGLVPERPVLRLAMFGARSEVLATGEKACKLMLASELDVAASAAILLFAFKNSQSQEFALAKLLYSASAYNDDEILFKAADTYLKAIENGHRPSF